jgi:hypothetical protein
LKLPKAAKKAKEKAEQATLKEGRLDSHLKEIPHKEWVIPYSDTLFHEAVIEWLVATDQRYIIPYMLCVLML